MAKYPATMSDDNQRPRIDGSITFTDPNNQPASATGGAVLPVADPTGVTVNTTTYSNTNTGVGKLTTLVFPADTDAVAIAIAGDAFPRIILTSDATDGWYFGDGTIDPYATGDAHLYVVVSGSNTALALGGTGGAYVRAGEVNTNLGNIVSVSKPLVLGGASGTAVSAGTGAPAIGGNVGDLYIRANGDPAANTYLYRCSVAGTAGNATWVGLVTS